MDLKGVGLSFNKSCQENTSSLLSILSATLNLSLTKEVTG